LRPYTGKKPQDDWSIGEAKMVFEKVTMMSPFRTSKGQARSMQNVANKIGNCQLKELPRFITEVKTAIDEGDNRQVQESYLRAMDFLLNKYAANCLHVLSYDVSLENTLGRQLLELRDHFKRLNTEDVEVFRGVVEQIMRYMYLRLDDKRKKARDFFWEFKLPRDYNALPIRELINNMWTDSRAVKRIVNPVKSMLRSIDSFAQKAVADPKNRQAALLELQKKFKVFQRDAQTEIDFLTDVQERTILVLFYLKRTFEDSFLMLKLIENMLDEEVFRSALNRKSECVHELDERVKKVYWLDKQVIEDLSK
jgi:hypothetical protein